MASGTGILPWLIQSQDQRNDPQNILKDFQEYATTRMCGPILPSYRLLHQKAFKSIFWKMFFQWKYP